MKQKSGTATLVNAMFDLWTHALEVRLEETKKEIKEYETELEKLKTLRDLRLAEIAEWEKYHGAHFFS
jgi:hypothetical protein